MKKELKMEKPDYYNNSKPKADNKHKKEMKKCMNFEICNNEFLSEHKFHRLCPNCRRRYS
tara:strand:+ start:253 stop:432 length:180 start_codon:yes stop_codon:yes gene_type:complete